jgi:hypothetical protein
MIKKIGLLLGSLVLTLLILEIALRLFPMPLSDRFFQPYPNFGWFHIPGRQGWQATPEYRVWITINQQGLRDSEHSYEKPTGSYRILLLGDSFVEGLQVPLEDTFGKQLEAALNASSRDGTRYEVINGGVSRFGTDNELLFYQFEGRRYQPDLVLLLFYHNDVTDNTAVAYFELDNGAVQTVESRPGNKSKNADRVRCWLWDHFQIYRLARVGGQAIASLSGDRPNTPPHRSKALYQAETTPELEYSWELTIALMAEINREVLADSARFAVIGISDIAALQPTTQGAELDWERPNHELGERLTGSGIFYIDLLPAFQAHYAQTGEKLFWPGDKHWNAAGHRLAAETVYDEIVQDGVIRVIK